MHTLVCFSAEDFTGVAHTSAPLSVSNPPQPAKDFVPSLTVSQGGSLSLKLEVSMYSVNVGKITFIGDRSAIDSDSNQRLLRRPYAKVAFGAAADKIFTGSFAQNKKGTKSSRFQIQDAPVNGERNAIVLYAFVAVTNAWSFSKSKSSTTGLSGGS